MRVGRQPDRLPEPPAYPVAFDGLPGGALCHGETDPRRQQVAAAAGLKGETPFRDLSAAGGGDEIPPEFETLHKPAPAGSGRELLAAPGPAPVEHLAPVAGRHAAAEAVTAAAYQPAGLKCPFHVFLPLSARPSSAWNGSARRKDRQRCNNVRISASSDRTVTAHNCVRDIVSNRRASQRRAAKIAARDHGAVNRLPGAINSR